MNMAAAHIRACTWNAAPVRCNIKRPHARAKKAEKRERGMVRERLMREGRTRVR
jgi:hypothetical protein